MISSTMSDHKDQQVGDRDKSVRWYTNTLEDVSSGTQELLENYSKIPKDQIIPHCLKVVSIDLLSHHDLLCLISTTA